MTDRTLDRRARMELRRTAVRLYRNASRLREQRHRPNHHLTDLAASTLDLYRELAEKLDSVLSDANAS